MRKSYFLAPSWDLKPDQVALGSIIANFNSPQKVLSAASLTIDTPIPPPIEEKQCSGLARKSRQWSTGLFATFIQVVTLGGEISLSSSSAVEVEYWCDSMETRRFAPSLSYIAKATEDTNVKEYLKMGGLGAKVFMITGIKIASNITIKTTEEKEKEMTAQVGVDIPAAQVTVGPKVAHKSTEFENHIRTIAGPVVFAFQLEKIRVNRKGKAVSGEYIDGAMLAGKAGGADEDVIERAGPTLDEDEIDDFNVMIRSGIDDETEEACEIIAL
jgi:hypothetical protein